MSNTNIKKENWFLILIYQIITQGVYGYFWFKNIRNDSKEKGKEKIINNGILVVYLFFAILSLISVLIDILIEILISIYPKMPISLFQELSNITSSIGGISIFLFLGLAFQTKRYLKETYNIETHWALVLFFSIFYLQYNISKEYNKIENFNSENINLNNNEIEISQNEIKAKSYIKEYKSQYPRDSIKKALINCGISESESEIYLNKYF